MPSPGTIMTCKTCTSCNKDYPINDYFYKTDSRTGKSVNSVQCKQCFTEKVKVNKKKYYSTHKEHYAAYNANPVNKVKRNRVLKERKARDPSFKTISSLKARMHEILRGYKNCTSSKLLDCTREQLYRWLESNFDESMTWDNYGTHWHIDHVIPIAFFDNTQEEQQYLCFNWSNLRPLVKEANMSKSDTIQEQYIKQHYHNTGQFCKIHQGYQVRAERCVWQRLELWYGNNPQDNVAFAEQLKRAIRSQVPTSAIDKDKEKVQRLNASGLETINHCQ